MLTQQLDLGLPAALRPGSGHVYALREAVGAALTVPERRNFSQEMWRLKAIFLWSS